MQTVQIRVVDKHNAEEKHVETRLIKVETERRLNAATARRILHREYPELGPTFIILKSDNGWQAQRALKPTEQCDYHYVWRHYSLIPA